jgi:ubiquinol-cytochrome c reductase cytochrome b subunit
MAFPWVERFLTRDRSEHNLADQPRDHPFRTAFGVSFLSFVLLVFIFGAADRLYVLFGIGYNAQLTAFRIGLLVVPAFVFWLTRRICKDLQASDLVEEINEEAEAEAEARERQRGLAGA